MFDGGDGADGGSAGNGGAALRLASVTMRFDGVVAVDDVSLTVGPGERWALIGPNGAGKTTLFKTVTGELRPTAGTVEIAGRDVTRWPPHRRARRGLGRTYQVTNLFTGLSVADNVVLAIQGLSRARYRWWTPIRLRGELADRVDRVLRQVGLAGSGSRIVAELSHGEQRQLELALALAGEPRLLLLDEPAAGLSSAERVGMRDLIAGLPAELTVVLIEHDMRLALDLVDRVLVLDNGRPIAEGSPDQVRADELVQAVYLRSD